MADAEGEPAAEEEVAAPKEPELLLRVSIKGIRGLPADAEPLGLTYKLPANEFHKDPEEGAEPLAIAGEVEKLEAGGAEQTWNFATQHPVPLPGVAGHEVMLRNFITSPAEFKLTGTLGGEELDAGFSVPLEQLVWLPPPDPDDDSKNKGFPYIEGWFPVVKVKAVVEGGEAEAAPEVEGEEAAAPVEKEEELIEVYVSIELSENVFSLETCAETNVLTFTVVSLHNIPLAWTLPEGDEGGEGHAFAYSARYAFPSAAGMVNQVAEPGMMLPAALPPAAPEAGEEGG
eukprot:CAMPEP_0180159246 /NCGR_PEP_ID=MMETSP0986-20121125/27410_1 /TAXON_ID=697907 /ORGANISM="non described non described, Strain CCMP2293" /LENGTH=286 /DNA_ID=CAMNT_0022109295 /DNA_START=52 /DNA_END=908 /DNA_ORIENTATION=-